MTTTRLSPLGCLNVARSVGYGNEIVVAVDSPLAGVVTRDELRQVADCLARYIRFAESVRKLHPDAFAASADNLHNPRPEPAAVCRTCGAPVWHAFAYCEKHGEDPDGNDATGRDEDGRTVGDRFAGTDGDA